MVGTRLVIRTPLKLYTFDASTAFCSRIGLSAKHITGEVHLHDFGDMVASKEEQQSGKFVQDISDSRALYEVLAPNLKILTTLDDLMFAYDIISWSYAHMGEIMDIDPQHTSFEAVTQEAYTLNQENIKKYNVGLSSLNERVKLLAKNKQMPELTNIYYEIAKGLELIDSSKSIKDVKVPVASLAKSGTSYLYKEAAKKERVRTEREYVAMIEAELSQNGKEAKAHVTINGVVFNGSSKPGPGVSTISAKTMSR